MALISDPGFDVNSWEADAFALASPEHGFTPFAAEPDILMTEADVLDPNLPAGVLIGIGDFFLDDPDTPDVPPTELSAPADGYDALPRLFLSVGSFDYVVPTEVVIRPNFGVISAYYYYRDD